MILAAILFWLSVAGILLVYAGYPLLLWIGALGRAQPVDKKDIFPSVTILISAYNEEASIGATIENKLALDYPKDKVEIIVVSDASIDGTAGIVRGFGSPVRLIEQPVREGKTAALNRAVGEARGEVLVFSDANSLYDGAALRKIVRNFADPRVGYVTGQMVYVDKRHSVIGGGCGAYMAYENLLRDLETTVGSVVGVDGGVDAVRASLFRPMRPDLLPDFVLPLAVVEQGYRVVYEPEALLMEESLSSADDEMRMRVRVILRSFHALWFMRRLFNPFAAGLFSFQLFMHKLLRYMVGLLQIAAFVTNDILAAGSPFYRGLFAAQVAFYAVSLGGYLLRDRPRPIGIFKYAYYLCLLNTASMWAFWKFINGERQVTWQPRKGN